MVPLVFGLFGLIIGSFLNVVILRHGAKALTGRSACLSCGHTLEALDLVPVFSWLFLRGRCRYCGSRISAQYPAVEASVAVLFALIGAAPLPLALQILALPIAALFVAVFVYDLRHTIIPDSWVLILAILALAYGYVALPPVPGAFALFLFAGPLAAAPLFFLWLVSRGAWMGLGDPKLALALGWLLGAYYGFIAVMFAFVIGAIVSLGILLPLPHLIRLARSRGIAGSAAGKSFTMKSEVAFGPFLVASAFCIWFLLLYRVALPL